MKLVQVLAVLILASMANIASASDTDEIWQLLQPTLITADASERYFDQSAYVESFEDEKVTRTTQQKISSNFTIAGINDEIAQEIAYIISVNPIVNQTLTHLTLENNKFTVIGAIVLSDALTRCCYLQGLDIRGNSLSQLEFKILNSSIYQYKQFQSLKYTADAAYDDNFLSQTFIKRNFIIAYLDGDDREIIFLDFDHNIN